MKLNYQQTLNLINMKSNLNKPKCGCGNTSDLNGYCDGSHSNK